MNQCLKSLLFLAVFIPGMGSPLVAAEGEAGYALNYLLPINHLSSPRVTLSVRIPADYKSISPASAKLLEFIPQGESEAHWTQIITLNTMVGAKKPAAEVLKQVTSSMRARAPSLQILDQSSTDSDSYSTAAFGATYETGGRKEVVWMRIYSGPADVCCIQYTKALAPEQPPQAILKELKAAIEKMSRVLKADPPK